MKTLFVAAIAGWAAWSSPAIAERYQLLPVITHMGVARLNYTALLLDAGSGSAFNCSAQFDAKLAKFSGESACIALPVDGKLPSGSIALQSPAQTFGWIPLWSVDQQSGAVTFCTAHLAIQGVEQVWCTPVSTRRKLPRTFRRAWHALLNVVCNRRAKTGRAGKESDFDRLRELGM